MKKIYVSLSAALIATAGIAQTQKSIVESHSAKSIVERHSANTFEISTDKPVQTLGAVQEKGGGGIVAWSDDFTSNAGWTIDSDGQTGATYGWGIGTTTNSWWTTAGISSTSGGSFASLNNGDPTANPVTQALDVVYTMTTSAPIDVMTAVGTGNVSLTYQQYGTRYNGVQEVYVSIDNLNWILVDDNSDKPYITNGALVPYTNPTTELINITSTISGGASTVYIRFSWTTGFPTQATNPLAWAAASWQIDDVAIVTNDDNNNTLSSAIMGQGTFQYPYYLLTADQVAPITFSGNVTNNGAANQPNTSLEVTADGSLFVSTPATLVAGANDSLVTSTNYTPSTANATYAITYDLVSDSTDSEPTDNVATKSIQVNDYIYGRDEAGVSGLNTTGSITNISGGTGQTFKIGNIFEVMNPATLIAVDAKFTGTLPTGGAIVYIEVYRYDAGSGDYVYIEGADEIDMQSAGMISQMQTFQLLNPVNLVAGDDILIVVGHYGSDIAIATAGDGVAGSILGYDASNSLFSLTNPSNVCVRMNFEPFDGIVENAEAGIKLGQNVPNPFNNNSTVNFELINSENVTFIVTDLTGKVIENINLGNLSAGNHNIQLNADSYSSGVYYYTMSTGKYQVTNKMIVQK
ncbi:MAG: hypothetical protein ACI8Q1_000627 [Parvicella sp.]|jgi:hypothetical protein